MRTPMNVYAIKFKEKKFWNPEGKFTTVLVLAKTETECWVLFDKNYVDDDGYDVDLRTVTWAGDTIPLILSGANQTAVIRNFE
jgi:hypothetical protein